MVCINRSNQTSVKRVNYLLNCNLKTPLVSPSNKWRAENVKKHAKCFDYKNKREINKFNRVTLTREDFPETHEIGKCLHALLS